MEDPAWCHGQAQAANLYMFLFLPDIFNFNKNAGLEVYTEITFINS